MLEIKIIIRHGVAITMPEFKSNQVRRILNDVFRLWLALDSRETKTTFVFLCFYT